MPPDPYYQRKHRRSINKDMDKFWGRNKKAARASRKRHNKDVRAASAGSRGCAVTILTGLGGSVVFGVARAKGWL